MGKFYDHSDLFILDTEVEGARRERFERYITGGMGEGGIWSPDGSRLAVLSAGEEDMPILERYRLGWGDDGYLPYHLMLYVIDAERFDLHRVTEAPAIAFDWSPDGSRIVFQSAYEDSTVYGKGGQFFTSAALYVVEANGGALRRLTPVEGFEGFPRWSPDGRWITYLTTIWHVDQADLPLAEIHVIDVETGEDRRLTDPASVSDPPIWSPDGKRLIYSDRLSGAGAWMLDLDGGSPRLVARDAFGVGYSFDGERIYAGRIDPRGESTGIELVVVNVETGEQTPIWPEMAREPGQLLRLRADKDGRRLVSLIGDEDGTHSLHELDLATSVTRKLVSLPPEAEFIEWTGCLTR